MAKHRKTLKQKKIADLRHKFYSFGPDHRSVGQTKVDFEAKNVSSVKTKAFSEIKNDSISLTAVNKYPYLLHDILKTGILTGAILLVQIVLFVLLKNKILVLPMVQY